MSDEEQRAPTPLTKEEAFAKALVVVGDGAVVGRNEQYKDRPLYVGKRVQGEFTMFGAGTTWEEAFADLSKVRDLGNGRFQKIS